MHNIEAVTTCWLTPDTNRPVCVHPETWPSEWPQQFRASLNEGGYLMQERTVLDVRDGLKSVHTVGLWANHRLPEVVVVNSIDQAMSPQRLQEHLAPWVKMGRMPKPGQVVKYRKSLKRIRLLWLSPWAITALTYLETAYAGHAKGPIERVPVLQLQSSDKLGRFPDGLLMYQNAQGSWSATPSGHVM